MIHELLPDKLMMYVNQAYNTYIKTNTAMWWTDRRTPRPWL